VDKLYYLVWALLQEEKKEKKEGEDEKEREEGVAYWSGFSRRPRKTIDCARAKLSNTYPRSLNTLRLASG
jgi:hypothetical protein